MQIILVLLFSMERNMKMLIIIIKNSTYYYFMNVKIGESHLALALNELTFSPCCSVRMDRARSASRAFNK